ncbi:MAG: GyrI-like domain-containing protein [Actinomycetota bacterium]|nr:GyrI-like domain-containing protein [Actinomycetota bacterium]
MPLQVSIKEIASTPILGVEFQGSPDAIGRSADRAYQRLFQALGKREVTPAAPPRLAYLDVAGDTWTMEASVPVSSATPIDDDIVARDFPGGKVASTIHRGPCDELGIAYRELEKWISENGHEPVGRASTSI